MFYVYILKSLKDGRPYKGMTDNLDKRIEQHNKGENKSTKGFMPWKLVYQETFQTRIEAKVQSNRTAKKRLLKVEILRND